MSGIRRQLETHVYSDNVKPKTKSSTVWLLNTFTLLLVVRFEVFTAVKIQVEVFWDVTPCSIL